MPETFGAILAEARNKRGLSLEQVSESLRIRPAILASLEREDYFNMPLKGHSRNMVSAYSRYLGLDSAAVTELFLQNYRDFEITEQLDTPGGRRIIPVRNTTTPATPRRPSTVHVRDANSPHGQGVRSIWDKPTPDYELRSGFDSRSPKTQRSAKNAARRRPIQGARGAGQSSAHSIRQDTPSRPTTGSTMQRLLTSTPLPLILLIILLVSGLVIWAVAVNSCSSDDGFIPVQSGGNGEDPENSGASLADILNEPEEEPDEGYDPSYGPFTLRVDPVSGTAPWVQITVDGTIVFADILESSQSFTVTFNCEVSSGQPGNTLVYRNGQRQELEADNNGVGVVYMEVQQRPVNDATTNPPPEPEPDPQATEP